MVAKGEVPQTSHIGEIEKDMRDAGLVYKDGDAKNDLRALIAAGKAIWQGDHFLMRNTNPARGKRGSNGRRLLLGLSLAEILSDFVRRR